MVATSVDVQIACDEPGIPPTSDIHGWVETALQRSGLLSSDAVEVVVRVVGADEIRTLNRRYRQQDKATNVLSFPAGEIAGLPDSAARPLGDVVVCAAVVAREADEQGKTLADHWGHMLVHGTLHLLGLDHRTESEAAEMEALEAEILGARNVTHPYEGS